MMSSRHSPAMTRSSSSPLSAASSPGTLSPRHSVTVRIELFGVPRLLAGERSCSATGATLGELAADLMQCCPALAGRVLDAIDGWPRDGYSFVVDEQFTRDRARPLQTGTSVLLVASAAGG